MAGLVVAVNVSPTHSFSKPNRERARLLTGLGVEGDAHAGVTVQHRSRVRRDPSQPNLRQVHLIHQELLDELRAAGFSVNPGEMGENITTRGIDLLGLPTGARLHLGASATVEITGLRNPCYQLDAFRSGLMAAVLDHDEHGALMRKAGVMAIVVADGEVCPGDPIILELPDEPHRPLAPATQSSSSCPTSRTAPSPRRDAVIWWASGSPSPRRERGSGVRPFQGCGREVSYSPTRALPSSG